MIEKSVLPSGLALRCSVRNRSAKMYGFCGAKTMKPRSASRQAYWLYAGLTFFGIGHVGGPAFEPVLADDHRPPLARLDVLGHEQNAVGEHVGKDVEHHFVAGVQRLVVDLPRARIGRQRRLVEAADHFVVEVLAILLGRGLPFFEIARRAIGLRPELGAHVFRLRASGAACRR